LGGKKTGNLDILFCVIPVDELNRIIADNANQVFLFSVIDAVQVNGGFLLSGLFPTG
jgi:hypothetical protein